jgi:type IV pilus assembly protein PilZ
MAGEPNILPTIVLKLPEQSAFLDVYYHQSDRGGVFVAGDVMLEPGTEVQLEIIFTLEHRTFRSRGVVRWRRTRHAYNLAAGLGVDFLECERGTRDMLLDFANGRSIKMFTRRDRRLPVRLEVSYATHSVFLSDATDDFSEGGMFIRADDILDVGTPLRIKLKLPGRLFAVRLRGEVAWTSSDEERRGFGVRFLFENPRTKKKVAHLVERLRQRSLRNLEHHVNPNPRVR